MKKITCPFGLLFVVIWILGCCISPASPCHSLGSIGISKRVSRNNHRVLENCINAVFSGSENNVDQKGTVHTRINGDRNKVRISHLVNFELTGADNDVHQEDSVNSKIDGDRNTVKASGITNFKLTGFQNVCELKGGTNFIISGNENQIIGSSNTGCSVNGNGNSVQAHSSKDLKIQGGHSKVVAHQARNIIVNGEHNEVTMRDIGVRHTIRRNINGSANHVRFTEAQNEVKLFSIYVGSIMSDILSCFSFVRDFVASVVGNDNILVNGVSVGAAEPDQAEQEPTAEKWLCKGQTYIPVQASLNPTPTTEFQPQLDISYVDGMSINGKDYAIGIFHFKLEQLKKDTKHGYASFFGIQIDLSELDESSIALPEWGYGNEGITINGKKDGIWQSIQLEGEHVMSCEDRDQFIVDLKHPLSANHLDVG